MAIEFIGIECESAGDAIGYRDADGSEAISAFGGYFAVSKSEALRLERLGVEMAYLFEKGGRIVTVPVN